MKLLNKQLEIGMNPHFITKYNVFFLCFWKRRHIRLKKNWRVQNWTALIKFNLQIDKKNPFWVVSILLLKKSFKKKLILLLKCSLFG
jgi:hypothetical protein